MGPKPLKLYMYVCVGLFLLPMTAPMEMNGDTWGKPSIRANAGNC